MIDIFFKHRNLLEPFLKKKEPSPPRIDPEIEAKKKREEE
jgi:hypothetical protein